MNSQKHGVESNNIKILLLGLDNSGKTSILLSLRKKTNLLSFCNLKPTPGIKIVNIDDEDSQTCFNIWDCGGQKKYLQTYFEDFSKQFIDVDKVIFVIDVQDIERYDLALDYLEKILRYIKDNNINTNFSIFLHKFDPGLEDLTQYSGETISKRLIDKIKTIIPKNFKYQIFKTTIYTIFQKQLLL
ncbi:MAG: ADP-ribosylation factor-like protein [Candidatus Helarchaeota archaeon]